MLRPVAGKNIYSLCPCINRELYIMRMIADDKRFSDINPKLHYSFFDKVRVGFDAHAFVRSLMRTDITSNDGNTMCMEV